jgi:hypothetical protein
MTQHINTKRIVRNNRAKDTKKNMDKEKTRIVLKGIRGTIGNADICRREGIHANMYYKLNIIGRQSNHPLTRDCLTLRLFLVSRHY